MQPIKQTVEAAQNELVTRFEKSASEISKKTGLPLHWVSAIFERFDVLYPHKWASGIEGREERAVEEWSHILDGLMGDDIKRGFDKWKSDWPPSAMEFLKACRGSGKNDFGMNYVPEYHRNKITDRSRLLSSDAREVQRKRFKENLHSLAESLRGQEKKTKIDPIKSITQDFNDYIYMTRLFMMSENMPSIIKRINTIKPGSLQ